MATGKKKRGRKPKVVESLPTEEAKANTTDPDSRIMKTRQGYVQGYNAQAVVSEGQIIVAVGVTQEANDVATGADAPNHGAYLKAAGIQKPWPMPGTGVRPTSGLALGRRCLSFLLPPPRMETAEDATGEGVSPVYQKD